MAGEIMISAVYIRREAFIVMAWSAIETFKKECLGFLLGNVSKKDGGIIHIAEAVPFQSVRRKNTEVDHNKRSKERFNVFNSVFNSAGLRILGYFHSHPEWGDYKPIIDMSETDIEDMKKNNSNLELIITISSRIRGHAIWEILTDGSIKGSWKSFNFRFDAYAIVGESDTNKPQRIPIAKPSVAILNKIFTEC